MIFYDEQESANEAMACAQIEYDKLCFEAALHDAMMTCTDAGDTRLDNYLPIICKANGLQYPPRPHDSTLFTLHTKAQNEHGNPHPWQQRFGQVNQLAQS